MKNMKMKEMPDQSRPYEKGLRMGPQALTDAELLAVILRSGTRGKNSLQLAEEILQLCRFQNGLLGIYHLTLQDLTSLEGIGTVKALQILCIGELSRRIAREGTSSSRRFNNPETIAQYYMEEMRHMETEKVICVMLDSRLHLIADTEISSGTVNMSLVSPREVLQRALSYHAVFMVLIHNHPSGDPAPSKEDYMVTESIYRSGALIGIELSDHIIIGDHTYFSFRNDGFMDRLADSSGLKEAAEKP
ncbi:MAG: DNA repair protein RadC [Bilifractor sp.]